MTAPLLTLLLSVMQSGSGFWRRISHVPRRNAFNLRDMLLQIQARLEPDDVAQNTSG
jgi:hypothetical protein